jgi:hypothetical protein
MTQRELDLLVAEATGENISDIRNRGFSLADPLEVYFDPEPDDREPLMVDWDEIDLQRNVAIVDQPHLQRAA